MSAEELMLLNCGVGEDSWESLGLQGDPASPKGNQSWIFIGRTDAEAPILWPPDMKNWLTGKDSDAGKDWRQEEKGTIEDETVGWHHRLDGQGGLVCCDSWGRKELDTTEQLNWTELNWILHCWRRKQQLIPLFLPGKSHGQRSLMDYSPWGHKSQTWLDN